MARKRSKSRQNISEGAKDGSQPEHKCQDCEAWRYEVARSAHKPALRDRDWQRRQLQSTTLARCSPAISMTHSLKGEGVQKGGGTCTAQALGTKGAVQQLLRWRVRLSHMLFSMLLVKHRCGGTLCVRCCLSSCSQSLFGGSEGLAPFSSTPPRHSGSFCQASLQTSESRANVDALLPPGFTVAGTFSAQPHGPHLRHMALDPAATTARHVQPSELICGLRPSPMQLASSRQEQPQLAKDPAKKSPAPPRRDNHVGSHQPTT